MEVFKSKKFWKTILIVFLISFVIGAVSKYLELTY